MSECQEPLPTGSDLELAAFFAEESRGYPVLEAELESCGCPICKEVVKRLRQSGH